MVVWGVTRKKRVEMLRNNAKIKLRIECGGFKSDNNFNLSCLLKGTGLLYNQDGSRIGTFEMGSNSVE
jgi:hypothetical protein